jgi:hypothetical protein
MRGSFLRTKISVSLTLTVGVALSYFHSGESQNREYLENPGFRVALRLPGMTILYARYSWDSTLEILSSGS